MFSHELFDFASTGNLADAHVDALDPYHDSLFDSFIDTSYVDQSFCSDFACCGQKLPDLHRLLEHFEEEHVLPLSFDARPLFSSPVYAQPRSADLAPYTSYILSYPQPDPPLQAVAHSMSAASAPSSPSLQFDGMPPVPDLTHTPLSPSPTASSATSAHSSPGPAEPICLPPSLFSVQPSPPSRSRSRRDRPRARDASDTDVDTNDTDEEEAPADGEFEFEFEDAPPARPGPTSKLPSLSGNAVGPGPHRRAKKTCSAARMDPVSASGLAARARAAERERERASFTSPATPKRRDGREKAYKCPHSGCTKSYLNPNGLKYHLEKGTCTNADARGRDPLPALALASFVLPSSVHLTCTVATTETATSSRDAPSSPGTNPGVVAHAEAVEVRA